MKVLKSTASVREQYIYIKGCVIMAETKQFKAESKRLLDLMINSIYTNKEIFLRETANASVAKPSMAATSAGSGTAKFTLSIAM